MDFFWLRFVKNIIAFNKGECLLIRKKLRFLGFLCMVINLAPSEHFSGANDVISMPCALDAHASLAVSTCFMNLAVLWTVIFASY